MSRAKAKDTSLASDKPQPALVAFLRELAARAEADAAFATQLHAAARASGLAGLLAGTAEREESASPSAPVRAGRAGATAVSDDAGDLFDPFVVLRERGEEGLRAALALLDLTHLRRLVRTHRLDPNRISARWSARERVIALIVAQVRARADHGKAFARV